MSIIVYHKEYNASQSFENFLDLLYARQMRYLASDLLNEGLSPADIQTAIRRAITAGKNSGLNIRRHFAPFYTEKNGVLISDCKLSRLGYALVLLNADPEAPNVARWQVKVAAAELGMEN